MASDTFRDLVRPVYRFVAEALTARRRRRDNRRIWEDNWSRPDYAPRWLNRGVSKEIVAAVEEGWFVAGSPALDIGCGQGEVASWLAERGFPALGLDIAAAAIARARRSHREIPGRLEFLDLDICSQAPPDRRYAVLIDRGCLHQVSEQDRPSYLRNVVRVSAPDARMLLFVKAFRRDAPPSDPAEQERITREVEAALGSHFTLLRGAATYLDPFDGRRSDRALPGMVFWLVRRP